MLYPKPVSFIHPDRVDILLWLAEQVGPHTEMIRSLVERYKKLLLCASSTEEREIYHRKPLPQNPQYSESEWNSAPFKMLTIFFS